MITRAFPGADSVVPRTLLVAMLLAFGFLVMRIAAVESPTMSSDEYAYVGAARYGATPDRMYQLDPGMQRLGNKVYPFLYSGWEKLSPEHPELAGRQFNAGLFVLGGLLLFWIFGRIFDRRSALISAVLYLALPFSFYSITLLPEVEFQVSVYLVSLVVALAGTRPRYSLIALAAALSALCYFVKPHGAALIAGCGAYWFATGLLNRSGTMVQRLIVSAARAGLYLLVAGALIVIVNKLLSADAAAGTGVVPSFYQKYLGQIFAGGSLFHSLMAMLDYLAGHFWLLAVYFTPGLVAIGIAVFRSSRGHGQKTSDEESRRNYFAVYVALLLISFLAMIAMFTASAATMGAGEQYRLHGRYLAALLPFLLGYSVWACGRPSNRAIAVFALAALLSFGMFGSGIYKLFPWDYPEAFGFFSPSAHYWSFDGSQAWTMGFVLAAGAACWLAAMLRFTSARGPFVVFTLAWMFASHAQMWHWLDQQSASSRAYIEPARSIEQFLGPVPSGTRLVLTQGRYGLTSSFLMGLHTLQHVQSYPDTHVVDRSDVPAGVSWVVAPDTMQVDIAGADMLTFGNQNLFLLQAQR